MWVTQPPSPPENQHHSQLCKLYTRHKWRDGNSPNRKVGPKALRLFGDKWKSWGTCSIRDRTLRVTTVDADAASQAIPCSCRFLSPYQLLCSWRVPGILGGEGKLQVYNVGPLSFFFCLSLLFRETWMLLEALLDPVWRKCSRLLHYSSVYYQKKIIPNLLFQLTTSG